MKFALALAAVVAIAAPASASAKYLHMADAQRAAIHWNDGVVGKDTATCRRLSGRTVICRVDMTDAAIGEGQTIDVEFPRVYVRWRPDKLAVWAPGFGEDDTVIAGR